MFSGKGSLDSDAAPLHKGVWNLPSGQKDWPSRQRLWRWGCRSYTSSQRGPNSPDITLGLGTTTLANARCLRGRAAILWKRHSTASLTQPLG